MDPLPPYARFLGIVTRRSAEGELQFVMPFGDVVLGRPGYLHGGAIAGLLEFAAIGAIFEALGERRGVTVKPINVSVNFMRGGTAHETCAAATVTRLDGGNATLTINGKPVEAWWTLFRTAAVSLLLVAVFGALFASADALFARWIGALVPDLGSEEVLVRGFVLAAFAGLTLAGVYVALCPPRVERLALPTGRPVSRSFEWAVPVGLVVGVFAIFVAAQLTVMFGGHAYLRRTTGLTYAEYVHQGFGQLTVTIGKYYRVTGESTQCPRCGTENRPGLAFCRNWLDVLADNGTTNGPSSLPAAGADCGYSSNTR